MPAARPGIDALVEEATWLAEMGGLLFFEAPTGYGKTSASPRLLVEARQKAYLPRLLHALPLRAIVEQAYLRFSEKLKCRGFTVGYQAHGLGYAGKAPFMASNLVVTTMDSLALNLFRWNVAEKGLGHYEVPRGHIAASMIVLDEAHMPMATGVETATALAAIIRVATKLKAPVLVETATMPERLYKELLGVIGDEAQRIIVTPRRVCPKDYKCVEDIDYYEKIVQTRWSYQWVPSNSVEEAARLAASLAESNFKIFLAASTVADAVRAFRFLLKKGLAGNTVLVHGRLSTRDRENISNRLENAVVLVGTSAVEAGVDIDYDILITDVPLLNRKPDWMSLLQRMGRICRMPSRCVEARVYIYGQSAEGVVKKLQGVNPRLPWDWKGLRGYKSRLLDSAESEPLLGLDVKRLKTLEELALAPLVASEQLVYIQKTLCDPFRGRVLVPAVVPPEGWTHNDRDVVELLVNALRRGDYVLLDPESARRRATSWLLVNQGGKVAALHVTLVGPRGHPEREEWDILWHKVAMLNCSGLLKLTRKGLAALVLKPGVYQRGVGLI